MKSKNHPTTLTIFIAVIALTTLTTCSNAETTSPGGGGNPNPFSFTLTQGGNTADLGDPLTYGAGTYVLTVTNNDPALADDYAFSYSPLDAITVSSSTSNTITFQVVNADSGSVTVTATHSSDNSLSGSTTLSLAKASYSPADVPLRYASTNTISVNGTYTVSPSVNNIASYFPKYPLRVSVDPPLSAISISNDGKVYLTTAGDASTNRVTVTFSSSNYVDFTTNFYVQVHKTPVPQAVLTLRQGGNTVDLDDPLTYGVEYLLTVTNNDPALADNYTFTYIPSNAITIYSPTPNTITFQVANADSGSVTVTATHSSDNSLSGSTTLNLAKASYSPTEYPVTYAPTNTISVNGTYTVSPSVNNILTSFPKYPLRVSVDPPLPVSISNDGKVYLTTAGNPSTNIVTVTFSSLNYVDFTTNFYVEVAVPQAVLTLSSGTTPFTFGAGNEYTVTAHLTNSDGSRETELPEEFDFVASPAAAIVVISSDDTSYTFAVTNASYGNVTITATHRQNSELSVGQSYLLAKADLPDGTAPIAYNTTTDLRIPAGGSGSISPISDVRTSYYPQDTTLTSVSGHITYNFNADTGAITFTGAGSYRFNLTFVSSNYNDYITPEFRVEVSTVKAVTYSSDLTALGQIITDGNLGTVSASTDALVVDTVARTTATPVANVAVSTIYATANGAGNYNGTNWENAIAGTNLRSAIIDISDASESRVYVVLVAEGTYSITNQRGSSGNQEFQMKSHTAIIGGFHLSESSDNITVSRSGTTIFDGGGAGRVFHNDNNGVDRTAVLYGVTVQNGDHDGGGGMYNDSTSPSVINTKFINNTSLGNGGGLVANNSSMYIKESQFISNASTASSGGGLYVDASAIIVEDTVFKHNSGDTGGGAIYEWNSRGLYVNVSIVSNTAGASSFGGGVLVRQGSTTVLVNTTLVGNNGGDGGFATVLNANTDKPRIINSILWANNPTNIYLHNNSIGQNLDIGASVLQGHTNGIAVASTTANANTVTSTNIVDTDPSVNVTGNYPTIMTGSSAENAGYYVRISGTFEANANGTGAILYFSDNTTAWYTDVTLRTAATLPANTRLLTGRDITGTARTGRPDIGAYEAAR